MMEIKYINKLPTDVQNVLTPVKKSDFYDYVGSNGKLYRNQETICILVTAEADLANLPDIYPPGSLAFTAGYLAMWQLSAAGTWVSLLTE